MPRLMPWLPIRRCHHGRLTNKKMYFTAAAAWFLIAMLFLNTHPSYAQFRTARAEMRKNGRPLDGSKLAEYLDRYSEKGEEYIQLVKGMIKRDSLEIADSAQLAKGPIVIFRPVSKK